MIMVLTSNDSLDFAPEISLNNIPYFSLSSRGHIDPQLGEKVDCPRPHPTRDHHVCLLGMDELRNDTGLVVWIVGIRNYLEAHYSIPFHIDKGMRISQLAIRPVPDVNLVESKDLSGTERGSWGFGSTGVS